MQERMQNYEIHLCQEKGSRYMDQGVLVYRDCKNTEMEKPYADSETSESGYFAGMQMIGCFPCKC